MEMLKTWLRHPKELYNLVWFKMGGYKTMMPKMDQVSSVSLGTSSVPLSKLVVHL
uniref:Uncharacterized protein n=1 Tax=Anolis carolinensis TaxID=28377 RepID=A0A803TZH2_ANOCA